MIRKVLHADFGIVRSRQDTECPECGADLKVIWPPGVTNILACTGFDEIGISCRFSRRIITLMRWDGETWRLLKC